MSSLMIGRRNNLANHWKSSLKLESGIKGAVETSFRHDFKIPDAASYFTQSIKPPEPARISISCNQPPKNVDETYRSVTKAAYRTQNTEGSTSQKSPGFDRQRIYQTNFKMSVDDSFNGYCTSHHAEFPRETAIGRCSPLHNYADTLSVLKVSKPGPFGNKTEDNCLPKPSYLDSYKPIPFKTYPRIVKKNPNEDHMQDTFPNPSRIGPYLTTSMAAFKGLRKAEDNPLSHTADLQKRRITSISFGDSDRFQETESVCRETYCIPCTDDPSNQQQLKYDKHSAHANTYRSSLNLGDPARFNEMKSTLLPLYGKTERSQPVQYERNASSFPAGDLNDSRVKERLSNTIRNVYSKPPSGSFPDYSVDSHLRALSHIHLGEKTRMPSQQSTMKQSYRPLLITGIDHMRAPLKDNIPFDYPGDVLCSTVKGDFVQKIRSENDKSNKMIMENLKKSHWKLPNMAMGPNYCTTHQAMFTLPAFSKN